MARILAIPATILIVLFAALMIIIPQFAPDTAVLSTYEVTPDREQAIYLMDVRSGLSYFSGLVTRPGNFSMWSVDGETIATVKNNPFPATFDLIDLTTGERQSYPMQAPNGSVEWQGHPTKIAYSSSLDRGSLMIYDRETGEEHAYLPENAIRWMGWLPDSDTLIVNAAPQTGTTISTLYAIDSVTNEVTRLQSDLNAYFFDIIDNPLRILYTDDNQLMTFSPDTPDDVHAMITLDEGDAFGLQTLPSGEHQVIVQTTNQEIWKVDLATGERELLYDAATDGEAYYESWSPDGEISIIRLEANDTSTTLRIVREGSDQMDITIPARLAQMRWSPDSRYLIAPSPSQQFYSSVYLIDTLTGHYQTVDQAFANLFWQPTMD